MLTIQVKSSKNEYPIHIGKALLKHLDELIPSHYTSVFIVADQTVASLYLNQVISGINRKNVHTTVIASGETSKSIHTFYNLHTEAIKAGLDRKSLIIALGGGMVGDLAGFVASTFMRGIDFVQLPTTILAHDSSVGGKVAINHEAGKNLIGNFHSPAMVIYDVATLQSLPEKEIRSGFAELMKEAMIANNGFYDQLLSTKLHKLDYSFLTDFLTEGMRIKAKIVEQDEKENGARKFLNFGHTLGHALEAELGYGKMTHGEAVANGMLFAATVSERLYGCDLRFKELLGWMRQNDYPILHENMDCDSLLLRMKTDKKNISGHVQMVLLKKIGCPVTRELEDHILLAYLKEFLGEMSQR
ncbi:3-dehydroquinate synthase [Virgibacillus halophilus]|uniref:3-dehydroquinate synthase n=1 Tax=Tigheibacillus halophilus TaxID=361280 RepID=UPI00363F3AC1